MKLDHQSFINSNYGWAKEIITNTIDGVLENPKNHEDFANAIITVLQNRLKLQEMAKNALLKVQSKFEINTLANQNIEFYKSIIKCY